MTENGKITAPVTIRDVARTIGVASGDLGRLCTSNNIKKFSKWKPIHVKDWYYELTEEILKEKNYGLICNSVWRIGGYSAGNLNVEDAVWMYKAIDDVDEESGAQVSSDGIGRPIGGTHSYNTGETWTSPFRLSDFNNYDHGAQPMFKAAPVLNEDGSLDIPISITRKENDTYGGLTPDDEFLFGKPANMYLYLLIETKDEMPVSASESFRRIVYVSNQGKVGSTETSVNASISASVMNKLMGDFVVALVLSSETIETTNIDNFLYGSIKVSNLYIYPYITNTPTVVRYIDNLAWNLSLPSGEGSVYMKTWELPDWNDGTTYNFKYCTAVCNGKYTNANGGKSNAVALTGEHLKYEDYTVGYLSVNLLLTLDIRTQKRAIVFMEDKADPYSSGYLNSIMFAGGNYEVGIKPLLRNLPLLRWTVRDNEIISVSTAVGTADIYLSLEQNVEWQGVTYNFARFLCMRVTIGGEYKNTIKILTHWTPNYSNFISYISLANIVSTHNQAFGMKVQIGYGIPTAEAENGQILQSSITNALDDNGIINKYNTDSLCYHLSSSTEDYDFYYTPIISPVGDLELGIPDALMTTADIHTSGNEVLFKVVADDAEDALDEVPVVNWPTISQ